MAIKRNNTKKICPFLDRECLKEQCEIHHVDFDKCDIGLLVYNLYALITALKNFPKRPGE
jgi:hypothetical protein